MSTSQFKISFYPAQAILGKTPQSPEPIRCKHSLDFALFWNSFEPNSLNGQEVARN